MNFQVLKRCALLTLLWSTPVALADPLDIGSRLEPLVDDYLIE